VYQNPECFLVSSYFVDKSVLSFYLYFVVTQRAAGEYDVEALKLTSGVLSKNPDVYTLWNYRKEIFNFLQKSV